MAEEVTITSLGAQGDGVTEDGLYVAHTLPGERVRIDRTGDRGRLIEILERSPDRAEAPCPHVADCGGCSVQHASDTVVATWKTGLIRDALASRGIHDVPIEPVITSPPASRRRITVAARRGKKGVQIGFHAPGSDRIVPISACNVARPELIDALGPLTELVPLAASRKGEVRITLTLTEGGVDAAISNAKEIDGPGRALLAGAANRASVARLTWNGETVVTRVPPLVTIGPAKVEIPAGGFLQATVEGQEALIAAVERAVGKAGKVVDLYAGCGTFTLPLAARSDVLAVEGDRDALAALHRAWRQTEGLHRVETERRDLTHRPMQPLDLKGVDALVIDPPRAGARVQAEILAKTDIPVIVSVSCNPATFARDARVLVDGGYGLDWIQPVDQFRWASHIELAARFSRG